MILPQRIFARHCKRHLSSVVVGHEVLSPFPDVSTDVPRGGITEYVMKDFHKYGDAPAITDVMADRSVSYVQLQSAVFNLAYNLQTQFGFGRGDTLALFSPNDIHFFVASQAVTSLGGVVTPINPLYEGKELEHQIVSSSTKAIISHPLVLAQARAAAKASSSVEQIFVLGEEDEAIAHIGSDDGSGNETPLASLFSGTVATLPDIEIDPESTAILPYSSGTTGVPKGVELTHRNLVTNLRQLYPGEGAFYREGDAQICPLPFFHIYGNMVALNLCMFHGTHMLTMPRFDFAVFLKAVQEYKAKRAILVPPIILALAKEPVVDKYDLSSLEVIMSAAAPLGPDLQEAASNRFGCTVKQAWGMTETSPAGSTTPDSQAVVGSTAGFLVPNSRALIVNLDSGEPMDPTEDGELYLAGPHIMKGYFNNSEANARDLTEIDGVRYFKTGDIAHFDSEGRLYITDRAKELIKFKGFQVAPAELEDIILAHPCVADACVVGQPDDVAGELPRAHVVLKDGVSASADDIAAFVADQVAPHKKLRGGVVFESEIPKTASGKILRRIIRDSV